MDALNAFRKRVSRHASNEPPLSATQFKYDQLDPSGAEFRLIKIHPGKISDSIRCSIDIVQWSQFEYYALSYTWGTPHPQRNITLNGASFAVGPALHDALVYLRDSDFVRNKSFRIWIDALCINQQDVGERNVQVAVMDQIY